MGPHSFAQGIFMKHLSLFTVLFFQLVSLVAEAQVPQGVQVQYVRTKGRGCAQNQVSVSIAPDGRSFSVLMDNYLAQTSPRMNLEMKNCALEVGIVAPAGWSYTLESADYRGFVQADAGTQVSHQVLYSFDGSRPPNERPGFEDSTGKYSFKQQIFNGPMLDNYFIRNQIDPRTSLWSPCSNGRGHPLIIETFLIARAMNRGGIAQITLDTVDGAIEQQFAWTWRQCHYTSPAPSPQPNPTPPPGRGGRPPRYRP